MTLDEVIRFLQDFGSSARVSVEGAGSGSAPLLILTGVLTLDDTDEGASFRIGEGNHTLYLWPDRFVSASVDELGVLEITTLDGTLNIEEDRAPWT